MLMRDAKKGITGEIGRIAGAEGVAPERLAAMIARGLVAIPRNERRGFEGRAIGRLMSTKINANVGTSKDYGDCEDEILKARIAVQYGADAVMDLSTGHDRDTVRKKIVKELNVPIGTVPIYHAARKRRNAVDMTTDDFFNSVREHADDGVDFVTVHCGVNRNALERLKNDPRLLNIVSRGGALTMAWMLYHDKENPFYEEFDYLLEICREYDLTLSLGDGMRPGCMADASDRPEFMEVITLGELVRRCRESEVQSIVEGPGHVPLDEVELSVNAMKKLTGDAPLYLLGPLVTDIAPGYDHIVGAIGGSLAGMAGADFLCIVTPSEHLALPTAEDIKEGVVAGRIAAHVADTVKEGQRERARELDEKMSQARGKLDWEGQLKLSIDPLKAAHIRSTRKTEGETCSMCSDLCAIKLVQDALEQGKL